MKQVLTDISLENIGRVKNSLDPIDPQDLVTLAFLLATGAGFQKYKVASGQTYTIPDGISSVVSGSFQNEGTLVVEGRLEIL